jgi:predicted nucleic acid-binding protein
MKIGEALGDVNRLFIDTAPVIYFVERNARYAALVQLVFDRVDDRALSAVTSPVTLAECLVHPYRRGLVQLQNDFVDLIVNGENTVFVPLDAAIARQAAQLRARYNLALDDAFQIATALSAECEAFLTNDATLQRVTDLRVIVLDELERD